MEFERVQRETYPCGCRILVARPETGVPDVSLTAIVDDCPEVPARAVSHYEAEKIRLRKLCHWFWGRRTSRTPNPLPVHCADHATLDGDTWYEALTVG